MSESSTQNAPDRLGFRTEIEGMRGIAVLLVLLYHATFPWIEGGYIGVDVFFVISGYLITRILIADFEAGRFSVRDFYVRRIRRLIPALLATILATIAAGVLILSPEHLEELGMSSIFAALSLSNVHFAFAGGYFETSSKVKPLLHTWSLSVEEQFYLVWPATLAVLFAVGFLRRHLFWLIGLALVLGLALSEYWIGRYPDQAYFLSPFRAYQLLAGAFAVWAERHLIRLRAGPATALTGTGLLLILGSALLMTEATPFPGLWGAIPTLGGFLVIAAGSAAPSLVHALSVSPLVWLGKVSYSVYLAHWPIIVYARYLSPDAFTFAEQCLLVLASLAGGLLLHRLVESPFRLGARGLTWGKARGVALVCIVAVAAGMGLKGTQGLPSRMGQAPDNTAYAKAMSFDFLARYGNGIHQEGSGTSGAKVLIFGDSMIQNYIPALLSLPQIGGADVTLITRGGCPMGQSALQVVNGTTDEGCRSLRDAVYEQGAFDMVIWGQSWLEYEGRLFRDAGSRTPAPGEGLERWREIILGTMAAIDAQHWVVFGPQVTVDDVPEILGRIGPMTRLDAIPPALAAMSERHPEARDTFATSLTALLPQATIIDPEDLICTGGACQFADGLTSYYFDPIHHTAATTPMLAERLAPLIPDPTS